MSGESMSQRAASWPVDGLHGRELWEMHAQGRFEHVRTPWGGRHVVGEHDLDALGCRTADCPEQPPCAGLFPRTFVCCPSCGTRLQDQPPPPTPTVRDVPNNGPRGHGEFEPFDLASYEAETVALPAGRDFLFLSPPAAGGLIAIARDDAGIHRWSRTAGGWSLLDVLPNARDFISGAATPVVLNQEIVLPTDEWVATIRFQAGRLAEIRQLPSSYVPVGGAAVFQSSIYLPVVVEGQLAVLQRDATQVSDDWRVLYPATPAPAENRFGRPLATQRMVCWPGQNGVLTIKLGEPQTATWRSWNPNFRPLLAQPPTLSDSGIGYQIGHIDDLYGFERLTASLRDADQHKVSGAILADGRCICRNSMRLMREPWDEQDALNRTVQIREDDFLYPICHLNDQQAVVAVAEGRINMSRLADGDCDPPVRSEVAFSSSPVNSHKLGMISHLRRPSQLQAFVYAGYLWVYDTDENILCRWRQKT